ncbi:zinc-ribbon domain-containing protein [Acidiphilium acidophilum]|uniref:zinc-ribbon domain-containing protein n=1 Tax=Acidiphilium acidophilum TaxID=76588 RepID=UPI002E8E774B|nr:zinc-ribbon domain-containing protein [Acidiphilium acidophilum]
MRITCPICAAQYQLPPEMAMRLPTRTRCARCGGEWVAEAEPMPHTAPEPLDRTAAADSAIAAPATNPVVPGTETGDAPGITPGITPEITPDTGLDTGPATLNSPAEPNGSSGTGLPRSRPGGSGGSAAVAQTGSAIGWWVGSVVLVVLLIAPFLGFHRAIGAAWPPSVRLYRILGL